MTRLIARADRWIHGFVPVTREGLAICRIAFASFYLLVGLPWFSWTSRNPPGFLVPSPMNIAAALSDFPSVAAMRALDVLIGVCFICLLVGFRTRLVSIVLTLAWTFGNSLRFSFGKIDHEMISVVTPAIMAFAGWGDFYSIDARRYGGEAPAPRTWPVSLLAFLIAYGFLSAGVPKLTTWIDFDLNTQGTRSWLMYVWTTDGHRSLLVPFFTRINNRWFWEIADWTAVAFEMSVIVSLVRLSTFRAALFAAVWFHLMNLLMLNIGFYNFLPIYLIFAPWERVTSRSAPSVTRWLNRIGSPAMLAALLVLFLPLYALEDRLTPNGALSHVGVVADLTRAFDFPWDVSLVLHALSLPIALAFAGLPIGIALPARERSAFPVIFFDGHCNLCNSFVDFVIRRDRRRVIRFASLQSAAGRQVGSLTQHVRTTSERKTDDGDGRLTIIFVDVDGNAYARSDAVLKIMGYFGGPYRLSAGLWLVPRVVRDFCYRLVSRHRYALFGQRTTCRMPTAEEQSLFLDADRSSALVARSESAFDSAIEITP
ncbi:MAG TPA: DCC1-like thiol-disulfide oxidoreductase family protein [Vicinamibacterales bacterium]